MFDDVSLTRTWVWEGFFLTRTIVAMFSPPFLDLLNCFVIRRGYAIPNFCVVRLRCSGHYHSHRHKHFVQTLSPLKFHGPIGFKFYVRHPGVHLYQSRDVHSFEKLRTCWQVIWNMHWSQAKCASQACTECIRKGTSQTVSSLSYRIL